MNWQAKAKRMIFKSTTIPVRSNTLPLMTNKVFPGVYPFSFEIISAKMSIPPEDAPILKRIPIPIPKRMLPINRSTKTNETVPIK